MVFSSVIFVLVFLPIVLFCHSLLYLHSQNKQEKGFLTSFQNLFLLLSSIFFYAWGEPRFFIMLSLCTYVNFHIALLIQRIQKHAKIYLAIGIIINLGLLAYFKYAMLFISPEMIGFLNKLLPQSLNLKKSLNIALPLGISFYTFQAMSYLIDVYRNQIIASQRFIDFACYLHMFPQLVAGPIVRYAHIVEELKVRVLNTDRFIDGSSRFTIGLAKKILIADTLGKVADAAFMVPHGELSAYGAWVGIICYTFQIYYDFSGYSDMAIGMGMMLGFSFPENFNYPYIADSIQNFWQRWHMSLSNWFKDYLYIPLGGNRKGQYRTYGNLFVVFLLCGLWHGASWTFVAWGAYYGLFLILERRLPELIDRTPIIIRHLYVIGVVVFGWVIFRSDSFSHAFYYVKSMVGFYEGSLQMNRVWLVWYAHDVTIALIFAALFSYPVLPTIHKLISDKISPMPNGVSITVDFIKYSYLLILLLVCMMPIFGATYNAFIYFRF